MSAPEIYLLTSLHNSLLSNTIHKLKIRIPSLDAWELRENIREPRYIGVFFQMDPGVLSLWALALALALALSWKVKI